jgi:hypothetical protein
MSMKYKAVAWVASVVVVAVGASFVVSRLRSEPAGQLLAYPITGHDSGDVVVFSKGVVTLQTCCGNESWGTYATTSDGRWLWIWVAGTTKPRTNMFFIEPGVFITTFTEAQNVSSFSLRRRVLPKVRL